MNSSVVLIGLRGVIESVSRYWVQQYFMRFVPVVFPLSTLLVNIVMCLLVGLFLRFSKRHTEASLS